jgi:hypothetical protein
MIDYLCGSTAPESICLECEVVPCVWAGVPEMYADRAEQLRASRQGTRRQRGTRHGRSPKVYLFLPRPESPRVACPAQRLSRCGQRIPSVNQDWLRPSNPATRMSVDADSALRMTK